MRLLMVAVLLVAGCGAAGAGPIPVRIEATGGGYRLLRGGEPYVVRGAGTGNPEMLARLKDSGGNSVRTWHVDDGTLLDRAQELGISVSLCLYIARERHGFDYDDEAAVAL